MPDTVADQIRLTIWCDKLKNVDGVMGKSDPRCDVYRKDDKNPAWFLVDSTEYIRNNLSPVFKKKIFTNYEFEGNPQLKFHVVDVDHSDANKWETIGSCIIPLQELRGAVGGLKVDSLVNENRGGSKPGELGTLTVRAEIVNGRPDDLLTLKMKGINIANKDGPLKGASDPYLIFKKVLPTKEKMDVEGGKTPYVSNTKNPEFQAISMNLMDLCCGQFEQPIYVECWDYDMASGDDQIGYVETTLKAILSKQPIQLKDYKEGRDLDPGQLALAQGGIVRVPTFEDYQAEPNKTKLTVSFGVDFSVTEDERVHASLPKAFNLYEQAIHNAGSWFKDSAGSLGEAAHFNIFGFGAKFNGEAEVSHCYELGRGLKNAEECCTKYWGMIKNKKVDMQKQRFLKQLVPKAIELAKDQESIGAQYHILIIVTHKSIDDANEAVPLLVDAADAPLSILIIGVGEDNFALMRDLKPVTPGIPPLQTKVTGDTASRNVLQFVRGSDRLGVPLTKTLPKQFLQYMSKKKLAPGSWKTGPYVLPDTDWQPAELMPVPDPNDQFRELDIGDAANMTAPTEGAAGA